MEQTGERVVEIGGVNINAADYIVSLDTDDEESDSDTSKDNTVDSSARSLVSNSNATVDASRSLLEMKHEKRTSVAAKNCTADVIIDLLDDSDEETNQTVQTSSHAQSNTSLNLPNSISNDDDEDDDVIFVGSDIPEPNKAESKNVINTRVRRMMIRIYCFISYTISNFSEDTPSAMIRIVQNDTVYVVSPAEIKKRVSSDAVTSLINHSATTNSITFTPSIGKSMSNTVWQSVPRDKSIVHSLSQSQVSIFN